MHVKKISLLDRQFIQLLMVTVDAERSVCSVLF